MCVSFALTELFILPVGLPSLTLWALFFRRFAAATYQETFRGGMGRMPALQGDAMKSAEGLRGLAAHVAV
jgi:hypothetical protein